MSKKELGQIFSPDWVVRLVLDLIDYKSENILEKYILEPSCGDGAFLCEIVKRYIEQAKYLGLKNYEIKEHLETYIYAIEIDPFIYNQCIFNLNNLVKKYNLSINWKNIINHNTLYVNNIPKMDYVVGNPPYVRSVNIKDKDMLKFIKRNYLFSNKGNIDLYIVFYEYGLNILKDNGKLCFITPNTFTNNTSFKEFRRYIQENKYISKILNFEDEEVFKASTYNAILLLDKNNNKDYFEVLSFKDNKVNIINKQSIKDLDFNFWIIGSEKDIKMYNDTMLKPCLLNVYTKSKYGINTLSDKIYISDNINYIIDNNLHNVDTKYKYCIFNGYTIENDLLVDVVKASKYRGGEIKSKIIFPYKKVNGKYEVISSEEMKKKYPYTYNYFLDHKDKLLNRDIDKNYKEFYQFGRSQGIQDFESEKLVVSPLFKDKVYINKINGNTLVYSGIYLLGDDLDKVKEVLSSDEFLDYAYFIGRIQQGSFKTLTTKIINNYRF